MVIVLLPICLNLIDFFISIEFFDPQQLVLNFNDKAKHKNNCMTEIEESEIYMGEEEEFLTESSD